MQQQRRIQKGDCTSGKDNEEKPVAMADETKNNEEVSITINFDEEISHYDMLESFLTDKELNDVTLKGTDGVEVSANRFFLAARSKIFRAMFFGKFREAKSPVVNLAFQGIVLRAVVEYIVTDSAEMLNTKKRKSTDDTIPPYDGKNIESLVSLAEAAAYFHLPELGKRVFALWGHICTNWPGLSLAFLQACRVAGPTIPPELTGKALQCVRALRFENITADQVSCLSNEILETILQDDEMEMPEYERFLILQQWMEAVGCPPSVQSDRCATAANLSKSISFEKIDARHLSTTVAASGLITSEKLADVYKNQALLFSSQETAQVMFSNAYIWTTDLPPDDEPPAKIKVEGAGSIVVNGIYKKDLLLDNGYCTYSMHGTCKNDRPCLFSIWYDRESSWTLSSDLLEFPQMPHGGDFYDCKDATGKNNVPPCEGWEIFCSGVMPPPKLLYGIKHKNGASDET
jgi:BTB/POZ domain